MLRKINEQTIFYFSKEDVEKALHEAIIGQLPDGVTWRCRGITAGLDTGGITYTLQRNLSQNSKHGVPTQQDYAKTQAQEIASGNVAIQEWQDRLKEIDKEVEQDDAD